MFTYRPFIPETPEPGECPECGARRQLNVDGRAVHARTGSYVCSDVLIDWPAPILMRLAGRLGWN